MPRACVLLLLLAISQSAASPSLAENPFRQLDDRWPTPDSIRRPSGAPGAEYWQQQVDYQISVRLDEAARTLTGSEKIRYRNNSPDELSYLWMQLNQNRFSKDSIENLAGTAPNLSGISFNALRSRLYRGQFDGGHRITFVAAADGTPLDHRVIGTMMRITLPKPLLPGQQFTFRVDWNFPIIDAVTTFARAGFEHFEDDGNDLFTLAQWFPRLCAYTDYGGWQTKQTTGQEFALEFGNYDVAITVPNDHIVAATGLLQNTSEVLTSAQQERLNAARTADAPVMVVTLEEATANETSKPTGVKTWRYRAENVRDFAFASSRKFLWDAQGFDLNGRTVLAMSFWPKEGEPLWSKFSTASVIHAVKSYSKQTFDFPYPVMISVNGPIRGMEYPMITFQKPRPEDDGTYSESTRNGLISVIIHEVGHNWFPMVVNSDERQWRWMDEGLNTFVQTLAEQEWDRNYPSNIYRKSRRERLLRYMKNGRSRPVMSAPETLLDGSHTAYSKPALALTVLRETVLGRETFDFAFQQYAKRWMFKRPTPSDFFRCMEDASGQDLDWFWNAWFYSTDHVDVSIDDVVKFRVDTKNPAVEKPIERDKELADIEPLGSKRNAELPKRVDATPDVDDFYSTFDEYKVRPDEVEEYEKYLKKLKPEERAVLESQANYYVLTFTNKGEMVTPLPVRLVFEDQSSQVLRIPAEVWRYNIGQVRKLVVTEKTLAAVEVDPDDEIADVDRDNNRFPRSIRNETFSAEQSKDDKNVMQKIQAFKEKTANEEKNAQPDQAAATE